ncbi:Hypothetical predicted protein [Cloeon dipterum]|uniref:Uncharacterized protein n=1 Tax=Cloeon dipterum TaxID=197152 RepID=A0A8S1CPR1_9INSE|nr:Hypothetical predicted protein [Cloeon dipterum]
MRLTEPLVFVQLLSQLYLSYHSQEDNGNIQLYLLVAPHVCSFHTIQQASIKRLVDSAKVSNQPNKMKNSQNTTIQQTRYKFNKFEN